MSGVHVIDINDGKKLLSITFQKSHEVVPFIRQAIGYLQENFGKIAAINFYNSDFSGVKEQDHQIWGEFFTTAVQFGVEKLSFKESRLHLAQEWLLELIKERSKGFNSIVLSNNNFGSGTTAQRLMHLEFIKALSQQVRSLDLSSIHLDLFGFNRLQELFTACATSNSLKKINLSGCHLSAAGGQFDIDTTEEQQIAISHKFKSLLAILCIGNIDKLILSDNSLHILTIEDFKAWLTLVNDAKKCKLKSLDLSNTNLHYFIEEWLATTGEEASIKGWECFSLLFQAPSLSEIKLFDNEFTIDDKEKLSSLTTRKGLVVQFNRATTRTILGKTTKEDDTDNPVTTFVGFSYGSVMKTIDVNTPTGFKENPYSTTSPKLL
jgi:hypothetical protein